MTSSTTVEIGWVRPGHCLTVAAMTTGVGAADNMVTRIVEGAVPVADASPTASGVTEVAFTCRHKVAR